MIERTVSDHDGSHRRRNRSEVDAAEEESKKLAISARREGERKRSAHTL